MDAFRFAPELFEFRSSVMAEFSERGFDWLSHYSAVDPLHDCYGIEVCGIADKEDAVQILSILQAMCPDWTRGRLEYKGYGREAGWKARISRDGTAFRDRWSAVP